MRHHGIRGVANELERTLAKVDGLDNLAVKRGVELQGLLARPGGAVVSLDAMEEAIAAGATENAGGTS